MDQHNPYAPSRASLAGAAVAATEAGGTWRDGKVLVLSREASLPPRCVRCNEPAEEPTKNRKVYWHSPWLYLLILFNLIIYAIVAAIVRKKAVVAPGLCSAHKKRRRIGITIIWVAVVAGFAVMFAGPAGIFAGVLAVLVALIVSTTSMIRILRPRRIDERYVRLTGCGSEFLDSMPQFPG